MRVTDWQVDCRQAPRRRNKLSLSSSIICVNVHASKSSAFSVRAYRALCISFSSPVSTAWLGDGGGKATLIHFLPPSWGSNWKIWVALLVCFGGMWWGCVFWGFSSVPLLRRPWGESSDGGQAEPCLWSGTSLSPLSALRSLPHLVASSPLTGLLGHWFSRYGFCDPVGPGRTDRHTEGLWAGKTGRCSAPRDKLNTKDVGSFSGDLCKTQWNN